MSSARWVVALFASSIVAQRVSLPGGIVPLLLVVTWVWCAAGLLLGRLEFDRLRLGLGLAAGAATALAALIAPVALLGAQVSLLSWGLLMACWAPAVLRLTDRGRPALLTAMRGCARAGSLLGVACVAMVAAQFSGFAYRDVLADIVPPSLLVQGYVITYPLEYGAQVMRANAWVGLEPSIVSAQLGVALVLAVLAAEPVWVWLPLVAGMVATASGSGVVIVLVALAVMLAHPIRARLAPVLAGVTATAALLLLSAPGRVLTGRAQEASVTGSSASLRALQPYTTLWPVWSGETAGALLGFGAGSSQRLIAATGVPGLLVPSPVKVLFDYGLVAGTVLALFLLSCWAGGPLRSLAVGLLVSSWALQPATTTFVLVLPTLLLVTWWSPRTGPVLESVPSRAPAEPMGAAA